MLFFILQIVIYLTACAVLIIIPALLAVYVGRLFTRQAQRRVATGIVAALPLPSVGTALAIYAGRWVASYKPLPGDHTGGDVPGLIFLFPLVSGVWLLSIVLGGASVVLAILIDGRRRDFDPDQ